MYVKRLLPKQDKSLKNYAIFRFSPKPRGTVSSARKLVFEKSVAKTVTGKAPSPQTRINTVFSDTSKQRSLLPLHRSGGFGGYVVDYAVDVFNFVGDSV